MKIKYFFCFILFTTVFYLGESCKESNGRKEVGHEGLIEITQGHSKYSLDYQKASQLLQDNKVSEAISIYLKLCKLEEGTQKYYAYMNLGSAYLTEKNYEKAIENYNLSIKLNNQNSESYVGLGSTYFALSDYKRALQYYRIGKEINPDNSNSIFGLAMSYDTLGIKDSAKINAKRFIELEPTSKYRNFAESILNK
jgi:tetratricopeptide (TPR) repeat protein